MLSTTVLAVSCALALLLYSVVYRAFFHPLAKVPGPHLARVTKLWLVWQVRKGQGHVFFPSLHERYGPIVRITPDTVLCCSEDAINTAYNAGTTFLKGDWYQVAAAPDKKRRGEEHLDFLTETNKERYRKQRRTIGPAYSVKGLEKHEPLLDKYIAHYISTIKNLDGKQVDLVEWMHIFALDSISNVTLSKSLDYTSQGNDGGNGAASDTIWAVFTVVGLFPWLVELMHSIPKVGMLLMLPACLGLGLRLPTMWPVFSFCVPEIMGRLKTLESTRDVKLPGDRPGLNWSQAQRENLGNEDGENAAEREEKDLLASLMRLHHDKEARFRPSWVLGIALTNFGAGHDTIMHTLACCMYLTYTHPNILYRLRQNMREANLTATSSYAEINQKVPLFAAILKESLRVYPAIGFFLPRKVPAGGATISSTYLPPGTEMGISLYATHHTPEFFPEPDKFHPDRWLLDSRPSHQSLEDRKKEIGAMDAVWMGFGGPSRSCAGQWLARMCIIKVLARFVAEIDAEMTGEPQFVAWFQILMRGVSVTFTERKEV